MRDGKRDVENLGNWLETVLGEIGPAGRYAWEDILKRDLCGLESGFASAAGKCWVKEGMCRL